MFIFAVPNTGELSEWLKEPASKTGVRVTVPGVRIPHSPQFMSDSQQTTDFTPTFTPNAENVGRNFLPYLRTTHSPSTSEPCLSITPAAFSFAILFQIARSETPIIIASSAAVTWELSRIA